MCLDLRRVVVRGEDKQTLVESCLFPGDAGNFDEPVNLFPRRPDLALSEYHDVPSIFLRMGENIDLVAPDVASDQATLDCDSI